jgi:hypothetical protein
MFVHVLISICNLSLSQQDFPAIWKQAAIVPALKRISIFVSSYKLIYILKNSSELSEFVIHGHVSHHLTFN